MQKVFTALIFVTLSIALTRCGTILHPKEIDRVEETGAYPAVVLLKIPDSHICTGTFIGPRVVLTAAHCAPENTLINIESSFGEFSSTEVIRYGSGTPDDAYDVALVVLPEAVADESQGQVLAVAPFANVGMRLRLVGYGEAFYQTGEGTEIKRSGTNEVSSIGNWIEFRTSLHSTTKSASDIEMIVGPERDAGASAGDSGGPALLELGNESYVLGVGHATLVRGKFLVTEYSNLSGRNLHFLHRAAQDYNLEIRFQQ